jgi:ribosomal protein L31
MKRLALLLAVTAFAIVIPAQAKKPAHPSPPAHPAHPSHGSSGNTGMGKGHSCTARNEGYNASGTLTSATLTAATKKGHYDGTITVDVTRANHKATTGTQTFTLTNARVRFGKGVSSTAPAAGSRVRVHGKITVLPHGCSSTGFTATTTIGNLEIKQAK